MTKVRLSENELEKLGLRIGRCSTPDPSIPALISACTEMELDILRLNVPAKLEELPVKLDRSGIPFYFSGGVRRYKVNVNNFPIAPLNNPVIFELYDGSQVDDVKAAITSTWGPFPIGYYRSPMVHRFINREIEIDALTSYYLKNHNHSTNPDNYLWIMKIDGILVGFIALFKYDTYVDSTIAGILPGSVQSGLFYDVLRHIRQFCRDKGLDEFHCGARNENPWSQRAFEKEYMTGWTVENIWHICPMFSKSVEDPIHFDLKIESEGTATQHHQIQNAIFETLKKRISRSYPIQHSSLQILQSSPSRKSQRIKIHFPVNQSEEITAVAKWYDDSGKMAGFGHFRWID